VKKTLLVDVFRENWDEARRGGLLRSIYAIPTVQYSIVISGLTYPSSSDRCSFCAIGDNDPVSRFSVGPMAARSFHDQRTGAPSLLEAWWSLFRRIRDSLSRSLVFMLAWSRLGHSVYFQSLVHCLQLLYPRLVVEQLLRLKNSSSIYLEHRPVSAPPCHLWNSEPSCFSVGTAKLSPSTEDVVI